MVFKEIAPVNMRRLEHVYWSELSQKNVVFFSTWVSLVYGFFNNVKGHMVFFYPILFYTKNSTHKSKIVGTSQGNVTKKCWGWGLSDQVDDPEGEDGLNNERFTIKK